MKTSRRLTTDDRRAHLLEVGTRLFSQHAYDAVSTEQIAAYAGVSKGLLYHYFAGKRGYYTETVREVARQVIAATQPDPELEPMAALRQSLDNFLRFAQANALLIRAMLRGGIGSDREIHAIVEGVRQASLQRLLSLFGGPICPPPRRTLLYGWVGLTECVTLDWLEHQDLTRAALVNLLLDALNGLLGTA